MKKSELKQIIREVITEVSITELVGTQALRVVKNNLKKIDKHGGPVNVTTASRGRLTVSLGKTVFARTYLGSGKWKALPADNISSKKLISDSDAAKLIQTIFDGAK